MEENATERRLRCRCAYAVLVALLGCSNTSNHPPFDAGSVDHGVDLGKVVEPPYLWYAGGGLNAFTQTQVQTSNKNGAQFLVLPMTPVLNFHDLAFDDKGDLWAIPNSGGQIIRLPADQLVGAIPPAPDLVVTSSALKGPLVLAFDATGSLWVVNFDGAGPSVATIVRFDNPGAMTGNITLTPSLTLGPASTAAQTKVFSQVSGIAFDSAGNLWLAGVSNVVRIDGPTALHGDVAATPAAILTTGDDAYVSVAFDASGKLWITGANAGYFALRIDNPGALNGVVTPAPLARVQLPSANIAFAGGMAFDADGALWIAQNNQIIKIGGPSALSGMVSPTPAVTLQLTAAFPDLTSKLVFRPKPSGLPIF